MDRIMEQLSKLQELSNDELTELEELALGEFETTQKAELSSETVAAMTKLADAVEAVRTEQARRVTEAAALEQAAAEAASRIMPAEAEADAEPDAEASNTQQPEPGKEPEVTEPEIPVDQEPAKNEVVADDDEESEDEKAKVKPAELSVETPKAAEASEQPAETAPPEPDELPEPAPADPPAEPAAPAEPAPATTSEAAAEAPAEAEASEAPAEDPETEATAEASTQENPDKVQEDTVTADAAPQGTGELAIEPPAGRQPQIKPATTLSITAGADVPGYSAGVTLKDTSEVADAFQRRLHSLRHVHGGDGEQHIVASFRQEFPSDRSLSANDPLENTSKIQGVTSPEAITAAAGVCLPLETRYELGCDVGVTDRPVRDALARFGSDRGGIRFFRAPVLTDGAWAGATGYWRPDARTPGNTGVDYHTYGPDRTTATNPVDQKPCLEVQCTTEEEALIEAVTLCLTFNNLTTRTFPELIKRHNELALVQHARIAENNLLAQIEAGSTVVRAKAQVVGATREIMNLLARAVAAYRFRHRMNNVAPLRMIAPQWVMELLRADLALQMPGDGFDVFDMAEARINAWFRSRGVNITWHLDGTTGPAIGAADTDTDGAGPDTADGSFGQFDFPSTIEFALFAEGTWLYLDGGTLDLGVIRDSSLVATNQYKQFVETFEGLANIGCESFWMTADYQPTGQAAALVDTLV